MASTIVAVTGALANAGAIVMWSLSGAADRAALLAAWVAAGFSEAIFPTPCTQARALRRTLDDACVGRGGRRLNRPLADGGRALVDESVTGDRSLAHDVPLTAVILPTGALDIAPADHPMAEEIRAGYESALSELDHIAIGDWLRTLAVRVCGGVAVRPTGGVYYIPAEAIDRWHAMTAVILSQVPGLRIYPVPAATVESVIPLVADALISEAAAALGEIETEVARGLGKRALETRQDALADLHGRLASYAGLLGPALDKINAMLVETQKNVAAAVMLAEGV